MWQLYRARAAASRTTSSSSGFSPAHSIISLQDSSAASIFSEQTERELILLLKTLRCYAFETVLKPCQPIARVLSLNRLYSSSNGNTRFRPLVASSLRSAATAQGPRLSKSRISKDSLYNLYVTRGTGEPEELENWIVTR